MLGDGQTGGVAGCQDCAVLGAAGATEKMQHLLRAQNHWHLCGYLGWDDVLKRAIPFEGDLVEKTQCRCRDEHGARRQLPCVGQVNLVNTDLLRTQQLRRFVEVARKQ
jgi:hypothetical protein